MRAPKKVIAAMAMATMIGGTGVQSFAAGHQFTTSGGDTINGQKPLQRAEEVNDDKAQLYAQGDITLQGTFIKSVDAFPEATEAGRYLRVSMPLSIDYQYDVKTDMLSSATGTIKNDSVYVETSDGQVTKKEGQAVNMTFVNFQEPSQGMEYVTETTGDVKGGKVQLPFKLVVTTNEGTVKDIPLKSINDQHQQITIEPNNSLQLKIDKIDGKKITNKDSLGNGRTTIGNNMTLKFEYAGK